MSWHVLDTEGRDVVTGGAPRPTGWASPSAALGAVAGAAWPLVVAGDDGRRLGVGQALGPGGDKVETLLDLAADGPRPVERNDLEAWARATPAGPVELPLAVVALGEGVDAAGGVDGEWLGAIDRRRAAARRDVVASGRAGALEAALHVAVLVATERFDPDDDADVDAHVASGARLWLLTGAVASALAGTAAPDPFDPWARLVTAGWWPVGPSGGRLVVSGCGAAVAGRGGGRRSGATGDTGCRMSHWVSPVGRGRREAAGRWAG